MSENRVPLLNPRKTSCFVKNFLRNGNLLKWKPQWIISLIFTICLESLKSQEEASEEEKPSEGNWSDLIGPLLTPAFSAPCRSIGKAVVEWSNVGTLYAKAARQNFSGSFRDCIAQMVHPSSRWSFLFYKDLEKAPYLTMSQKQINPRISLTQ